MQYKEAVFQYKCRLCGEVHDDAHTSEKNAQMILICAIQGQRMPKIAIGVPPELLTIHAGCKVGGGVSDLIGYVLRKDHDEKCEHQNWRLAGYPENIFGKEYVRVQSIYEVYCNDCNNFVNLITKKIINDKGLIVDHR